MGYFENGIKDIFLFDVIESRARDLAAEYNLEYKKIDDLVALPDVGIYSIYAALRKKGANVHSFEPEYANLNLLKNNVIINSLNKKINLYSFAFGEKCEISNLYIQDFTPGSSLHTV